MSLEIRTVVLELLRAGPPHNQLLSPLTQYLGICGESGAGVVTLPYEHAAFERRLRELRYEAGTGDDPARRQAILRDTGTELAKILGSVPGLPGALTTGDGDTLTHVRLVLSASELALLPFELSKVPTGAEGPGANWLVLQTHAPVCLTRHIRSVPYEGLKPAKQPRILFVSANPEDVPFEEHRKVLCESLEPWLYPGEAAEDSSWLKILENATLEQVKTEFVAGEYTHVHILAHGAVDESSAGESFGLAFRDDDDDVDLVSGERFATALGSLVSGGKHRPTVVTVAACDSANVGSVVHTGASFAHQLHQSGIPLVVASQFPLSFEGSVLMTETLYRGLLWGDHPWLLLHRVRTELHSQLTAKSHDWASVVVYEALPSDLEGQLEEYCYLQSKRAVNAALKELDDVVAEAREADFRERRKAVLKRVERAVAKLPTTGSYGMEGLGLKASSAKRRAGSEYRLAQTDGLKKEERQKYFAAGYELLEDSLEDYRLAVKGFMASTESIHRKASLHWVLVQMIALSHILGRELEEEYWATAKLSAEMYLELPEVDEQAWAHGSLAELWLLKLAGKTGSPEERAEVGERARQHAARIVKLFPRRGAFPVYSTQRQFERYVGWWGDKEFARQLKAFGVNRGKGWDAKDGVVETAKSLVAVLGKKAWKPPSD